MTKAEILELLEAETHTLFTSELLDKVNAAFGTSLLPKNYTADGSPKGLQEPRGTTRQGIAAFDLAPMLCAALGVKYESMMGRGFQVQACVAAIRASGKIDA